MKYLVVYQPSAELDLDRILGRSFESFPLTAASWCGNLLNAIETLSTNPERCPIARENNHFPETIRQLLYGGGRRPYRILFAIDSDRVRILHIRHPGQPLIELHS